MKIKKGNIYSCISICRNFAFNRRFIGMGKKYETQDGETYYQEFSQDGSFYVFEKLDTSEFKNSFKFAICVPKFNETEFNGIFQAVRYGDNLAHIFVEFSQPYFAMSDEWGIEVGEFPKKYHKGLRNFGNSEKGKSFIGKQQ